MAPDRPGPIGGAASRGRSTLAVSVAGEGKVSGQSTEHRQLAQVQRARLVAAMADVASEHGFDYATVARIVARSGVSRRTFYEQFVDREECFLAVFEQVVGRVVAVVLPAYRQPAKWNERVRSALVALLALFDSEPAVARLVIVEALGAGPKVLEHRRHGIAQIIAVVDQDGRRAGAGEGPSPLTSEGIVGGALSLIHSRLVYCEDVSLIELLNPLVSMIVLPYLGPAAARREFARPLPPARKGIGTDGALRSGAARGGMKGNDPLRDLDMRLTYRTVRVLRAIGELDRQGSRPSNRKVADHSDIRDQGQISKLLARLEQIGLIDNTAPAEVKGEPNAWALTRRGAEVYELLLA